MIQRVKNSFRTRLIAMFLAAIVGSMAVMILGCNLFLKPLFINNSKKGMQKYSAEVCNALEQKASEEEIKELLGEINHAYVIKTTILSEDRVLLFNENGDGNQKLSKSMEYTIEWLQSYEIKEGYKKPFFMERYDSNDQIKRLFYVQKTQNGKYVIMNKAIKGIEQDMQLVSIFITGMGIAVAVVGVFITVYMTRPFIGQMEKMSRITRNMSRLNFDEKIDYHRQDEIGILADSIDEMSEQLKMSIESLQKDLESRKHLVRNISHELKTPITTIRGYAENMQIVASDNERIKRYAGIMVEECDEIDALIGEMLEMSRLECSENYEMEWITTEELFHKIIQKNQIQYPEVTIQYNIKTGTIYTNAQLLERAIQNYIQNAVKYRSAGTVVLVECRVDSDIVQISVTNEGNTIPKEELENLWDVFYKSDRSRKRNKSHGIGLAIVQQTAYLLGGGVDVKSENGYTTFSIWTPCRTQKDL